MALNPLNTPKLLHNDASFLQCRQETMGEVAECKQPVNIDACCEVDQ